MHVISYPIHIYQSEKFGWMLTYWPNDCITLPSLLLHYHISYHIIYIVSFDYYIIYDIMVLLLQTYMNGINEWDWFYSFPLFVPIVRVHSFYYIIHTLSYLLFYIIICTITQSSSLHLWFVDITQWIPIFAVFGHSTKDHNHLNHLASTSYEPWFTIGMVINGTNVISV